jgi:hypothetical protein
VNCSKSLNRFSVINVYCGGVIGVGTSLVDADDLIRVSFDETGLVDPTASSSSAKNKRIGSLYEDMANKSNAVPEQLQGIGVGHTGWISSSPDNLSDLQPTSTTEKNTALGMEGIESTTKGTESNIGTPFTPIRVDTFEWQVLPSVTVPSDIPPISISKDDPTFYRQFRQSDLNKWRAKFRPEVSVNQVIRDGIICP